VRAGPTLSYTSRRHLGARISTELAITPSSRVLADDPLATFLTARWALFTTRRGRTIYLPNHHEPWTLHSATLVKLNDRLLAKAGFAGVASRAPDSVLYSPGVATTFGRPQ
jgi:uncharacterized protein